MGKYYRYAKEIDELAREKFAEYEKAKDAYDRAERLKKARPVGATYSTDKERLEALNRDVAFKNAEAELKRVQDEMQNLPKEAKGIRDALIKAIKADTAPKPNDLNKEVVDLLASGICEPDEIVGLYNNATNVTTKRYIAGYAQKEADRLMNDTIMPEAKKNSWRSTLMSVATEGGSLNDAEHHPAVQYFDVASECLKRSANNPAMIPLWGELTSKSLAEM